MNPFSHPFPTRQSRIGFHYYPDTLHYRESDLQAWLPELSALGASWLVLKSEVDRAISENFIRGLVAKGIEPIIQFDLSLAQPPLPSDLNLLFEAYARWGVHGVILFDRPNARSSWPGGGWAQQDIVDRFVDSMLPLSLAALNAGLTPIFPPLEPGGSYWDTAFLRAALEALERRKQVQLLQNLVLSVYSWTGGHPLNWGAGGSTRWPGARPYFTPSKSQDHQGFRIFEWYQDIVQSILKRPVPMIMLAAGIQSDPLKNAQTVSDLENHPDLVTGIVKLLSGKDIMDPLSPQESMDPVSPYVLACNLWLLAADEHSPLIQQAWYQPDGVFDRTVQSVKRVFEELSQDPTARYIVDPEHPINHYLLIPTYDWGIADWHLEIIRPFVKKYRPVVGFSIEEARLAREVTVIGNAHSFSEEQLNHLRNSGCRVRRISGDGTSIATQLTER
ncbi:MAG TPA: hypothetical protein VMS73_08700 [Anaerolineaceae bacterium]|nr:hypothetical protein [Anaerolineaceae bacterium]